jgi:hypothetical protein
VLRLVDLDVAVDLVHEDAGAPHAQRAAHEEHADAEQRPVETNINKDKNKSEI